MMNSNKLDNDYIHTLIAQYKDGNRQAIDELFDLMKNSIIKISHKKANRHNLWDAREDINSLAYISFLEAVNNFKPEEGVFVNYARNKIKLDLIQKVWQFQGFTTELSRIASSVYKAVNELEAQFRKNKTTEKPSITQIMEKCPYINKEEIITILTIGFDDEFKTDDDGFTDDWLLDESVLSALDEMIKMEKGSKQVMNVWDFTIDDFAYINPEIQNKVNKIREEIIRDRKKELLQLLSNDDLKSVHEMMQTWTGKDKVRLQHLNEVVEDYGSLERLIAKWSDEDTQQIKSQVKDHNRCLNRRLIIANGAEGRIKLSDLEELSNNFGSAVYDRRQLWKDNSPY